MGQKKPGIHFQALARLRLRLVEAARIEIDPAAIGVDDQGERVELDRAFCLRNSRIKLPERGVAQGKPVMGRGVVRLQVNRALITDERLLEMELQSIKQPEGSMRFSQRIVERERLFQRGPRSRKGFAWRDITVGRQQ